MDDAPRAPLKRLILRIEGHEMRNGPSSRRDLSAEALARTTPLAPKTTCHLASHLSRRRRAASFTDPCQHAVFGARGVARGVGRRKLAFINSCLCLGRIHISRSDNHIAGGNAFLDIARIAIQGIDSVLNGSAAHIGRLLSNYDIYNAIF